MIVQDIYLEDYDWSIRVYYATTEYFISNILIDLVELDCDRNSFFRIKNLMEAGQKNIGFTYSNTEKRASLMLIGVTDSADEFQSTFDHEKGHLAMHICEALDIEPFSEEYQYLTGEIGKQLFKEAKKFLCEHCRKDVVK
jgi:hypothetical protein